VDSPARRTDGVGAFSPSAPGRPEGDPPATVLISEDVDELRLAYPGIDGSVVAAGRGDRASELRVRSHDGVQLVSMRHGFPLLGSIYTSKSCVALVITTESPVGARCDGEDVRCGQVNLYAPGSRHQSFNPPGLCAQAMIVDLQVLEQATEVLGRDLRLRTEVLTPDVAQTLISDYREIELEGAWDDLMRCVASAVSEQPYHPGGGGGLRTIHSQEIVAKAIDYLEETGQWMPSSLELCRAMAVSERRLQLAFQDVFDLSPSAYLRRRALSVARGCLQDADSSLPWVHQVAEEHGFAHHGRFALYYRDAFGESPSETLAARTAS